MTETATVASAAADTATESGDLPEGWKRIALSRITLPVQSINPASTPDRLFHYVDISSIDNERQRLTEAKEMRGKDAPSRARRPIQSGDVLFSNVRTYLRNIALVPDGSKANVCSTGFTLLRPNAAVVPQYLFYWVITNQFIDEVTPTQTGTHYPATSDRAVLGASISLPPLAEQKRIVAEIDRLLAEVNKAREHLDRVPKLLKRFRQSILAAATTGRLTEDWRRRAAPGSTARELVESIRAARQSSTRRRDTGPEPEQPNDLPTGWAVVRVDGVSECLDRLRVPVNKDERDGRKGNIPYYGANGQVGWIDRHLFDEDLVLVVEDETFIGREKPFSYVIRGKAWVNNHAHVLRPLGGMSADYLNILLSYYDFVPLTSGTTGRRKLNQAALIAAPVAIAPLEEQREIVRRIQVHLAAADEIEASLAAARNKVATTPQAIFAKAFRGELVPTEAELARTENRPYESATQLLARISSGTALPALSSAKKRAKGRPAGQGRRAST